MWALECFSNGLQIDPDDAAFCIKDGSIVALHGFIKKTRKTPAADLKLAQKRMEEVIA